MKEFYSPFASRWDVVLAFEFGAPGSLPANLAINHRARILGERHRVPVFSGETFTGFCGAMDEKYLSTLRYIKRFVEVARKNGWKRVLIVAGPDHTARCVRDLKRFGLEASGDYYLPYLVSNSEVKIYALESTQWWTRRRWVNLVREAVLRLLPWRLYDRITG